MKIQFDGSQDYQFAAVQSVINLNTKNNVGLA